MDRHGALRAPRDDNGPCHSEERSDDGIQVESRELRARSCEPGFSWIATAGCARLGMINAGAGVRS
jgi:hypothetical protein